MGVQVGILIKGIDIFICLVLSLILWGRKLNWEASGQCDITTF